MKKLLAMFAAVMIIAGVFAPCMTITAGAVKSGDWDYVIENGTAKVKKYTGAEQTVNIPKTLGGKK